MHRDSKPTEGGASEEVLAYRYSVSVLLRSHCPTPGGRYPPLPRHRRRRTKSLQPRSASKVLLARNPPGLNDSRSARSPMRPFGFSSVAMRPIACALFPKWQPTLSGSSEVFFAQPAVLDGLTFQSRQAILRSVAESDRALGFWTPNAMDHFERRRCPRARGAEPQRLGIDGACPSDQAIRVSSSASLASTW